MSDDDELFDALLKLLPSQLDAVIVSAGAPRQYLSAPTTPQATRVAELLTWAKQSPENLSAVRDALAKETAAAATTSRDERLDRWLEWCYRDFRRVRVVGYETKQRIFLDLEDVFVPLQVRPLAAARDRDAGAKAGMGAETDAGGAGEMSIAEALALVERVRASSRPGTVGLALVGDPGAGKTTLLRHLFSRARREGSASIGLPEGLTPLFVRFSRLESLERKPRALGLAIQREAEANGYPGAADALIASGRPLLVLLDGIDEVRDEPTRVALSQWLDREVDHWKDSRFVATCRTMVWQREPLSSSRFLTADVQWLAREAIRDYVGRWFQAVERGENFVDPPHRIQAQATADAARLLEILFHPDYERQYGLREMRGNPLLLATLCLVHHSGRELPRRRGELYDRCIGLLLEAWARERSEDADQQAEYLPNRAARQVLQPLAWAMQEAAERERAFTGAQVMEVIADPLRRAADLELTPEQFLDRARDRCGVLVSRDLDRHEFFHASFREYLAAAHAAHPSHRNLIDRLARHAGDPGWRETILLAMSMPGVFRSFMERLLEVSPLEAHAELVEACVRETVSLDHEPFAEVLARAARGGVGGAWDRLRSRTPSPQALGMILRLFESKDVPGIREAAARLMKHRDPGVRKAVARPLGVGVVAGVDAAARTGVALKAGDLWRDARTGLTLLWIPPGEFLMGSSNTKGKRGYDPAAYPDERPPRRVRISEGFWIGQHVVTNESYGRFLAEGGPEPDSWRNRRFNAPQQPVVDVSAFDAERFCRWTTKRAELTGDATFNLPTEAEWEFAARGPEGRRYPWGDADPTPERAVWWRDWETGAPAPIGQRPQGATPWGVHDLAGNVWEWCLDEWSADYSGRAAVDVDPCRYGYAAVPRVLRGGSWRSEAGALRSAARNGSGPRSRRPDIGFRVVCSRVRPHVDI